MVMGLRGPKPKSAKLESAQGYPGRRKKIAKTQQVVADAADDNTQDSAFVPPSPPRYLRRKRERDVWHELTADPARQIWFKQSDHFVIARYCDLEARRRVLAGKSLPESYTTKSTTGARVEKANPKWTAYTRICTLLSTIEMQIGGTPLARMNIAHKMGNLGAGNAPVPRGKHQTPPAQPGAAGQPPAPASSPASPIGILKARSTVTPPPGSKPN